MLTRMLKISIKRMKRSYLLLFFTLVFGIAALVVSMLMVRTQKMREADTILQDYGNYDIAFCKAVELTKHLMKELNIPLERVVRHYDASCKNCPASMSKNGWALWNTFKNKLTENEEDLTMAQYDELKKEIENIRTDVDKLKNKMVYAWVDDNMPEWAKPTVTKLMRKGYLKGDNEGKLMLYDNMLRILVINDRAGIYGE